MKEIVYRIKDSYGLHARPASLLAVEAAKYCSKISVKVQDTERNADAKEVIALLSLGVIQGEVLCLQISGVDEEQAFQELKILLEQEQL